MSRVNGMENQATMLRKPTLTIPVLIALLLSLVSANLGAPIVPHATAHAKATTMATATPAIPAAAATPTRVPAPRVTHHIIFIGDSLTRGYFATTRARDFAYRIAARTHETFAVQGRYGVSAAVTAQQMRDGNSRLSVIPADTRVVVIELGTNDVVARGETLAQFMSAYQYILTRVRRDAPHARIICLGVWRNPAAGAHESGYAYNRIIRSACPGKYLPLGDLFMNGALHGPVGRKTWVGRADWFHPNDAGHTAIAARVVAAMAAFR